MLYKSNLMGRTFMPCSCDWHLLCGCCLNFVWDTDEGTAETSVSYCLRASLSSFAFDVSPQAHHRRARCCCCDSLNAVGFSHPHSLIHWKKNIDHPRYHLAPVRLSSNCLVDSLMSEMLSISCIVKLKLHSLKRGQHIFRYNIQNANVQDSSLEG